MTFARLLRLSSTTATEDDAGAESVENPPAAWPHDNPMLLGISRTEFTPRVRRAIWALLGEARNLRTDLERTRTSLKEAERAIDRDPLLPIMNRRAFVRELERQIATTSRYATAVCLAYIDLDGLKLANDTHGHACGDAVLSHFLTILLGALRSSDLVGRLGGDEFGLILLQANDGQGQLACRRICELSASKPLEWKGNAIQVRFAFGTVQLSAGMSADTAVAVADAAMYRQKALRR